jgi:DNA-binding Lrp family transcriptional regulator
MDVAAYKHARLPRFRRAPVPPAFRFTDGDLEIIRVIAKHRLIRSTHIAALVGRSVDRANERLSRLFHAGYIDRPRAQLDYYPTSGSAPYVYSLADRGASLLRRRDGLVLRNPECSRKNREAGRPFIEHQLEIVNFHVALQRSAAERSDVRIIPAEDMLGASQPIRPGAAFALRARLGHRGAAREVGLIPDLVFGLQLADGRQLNFMTEIDRGTMPVRRSDPSRTSFEQKMRVYLAAHAAKQHERQFGWKNFRVLTITTDRDRLRTMQSAAEDIVLPRSIGASLFLFATYADLHATSPLDHDWLDGSGRAASLL